MVLKWFQTETSFMLPPHTRTEPLELGQVRRNSHNDQPHSDWESQWQPVKDTPAIGHASCGPGEASTGLLLRHCGESTST